MRKPQDRQAPKGAIMTQWVVYDHPSDHPDGFVMRACFIMEGGTTVADTVAWKAGTIDELRALVPFGFVRLPRCKDDAKVIAEVWV